MQEEVGYNQIITFARDGVDYLTVVKSYVEEGKLVLVLEDTRKLLIEGRHVDTTGRKDRIQEILAAAQSAGFTVESKAVTHYASNRHKDDLLEYVLIKW